MRENLGFFAHFFTQALDSMDQAVNGSGSDLKVGSRTRAASWEARERFNRRGGAGGNGGDDYYLVPPERALVPIAVYAQEDGPLS